MNTKTTVSVSIHPPRVGRDLVAGVDSGRLRRVSIHPPRVGRDPFHQRQNVIHWRFNPPSPCGEGLSDSPNHNPEIPVSIHPPRVGRDRNAIQWILYLLSVSIHPPRVGRDYSDVDDAIAAKKFQSTLPVWGGTSDWALSSAWGDVSIHPPRVGRDLAELSGINLGPSFNPPSPCGEGH